MDREFTVRIAGEAGQGIQSAGEALCRAVKHCGLHLFAHQDYMSRVRGGDNFFQLRISEQPVHCPRERCDIVVALSGRSAEAHAAWVADDGQLVADTSALHLDDTHGHITDMPLVKMAEEIAGTKLAVNSVAVGLIAKTAGIAFKNVEYGLQSVFSAKKDIAEKNIKAAKKAYETAGSYVAIKKAPWKTSIRDATRLLIDGNQAIALGAIRAGCKFYSGYPMTPSTSIMNALAHFSKQYGIVVEQAEDEIAAINMVIGASFAGARAMTGTSGGGFALMGEGISLAGMTETPVVIVDAQRPAPATGFPTRTEQADLNMVIHSGHGEFVRGVYAPGSIEQAFYLTVKAFNMADKYQMPVIVLTDQSLADSVRAIAPFQVGSARTESHILDKESSRGIAEYHRYQLTESGISPRAVPSWIDGVVYADSDEHTEEGHITEDATVRNQMVAKRLTKKLVDLTREIEEPESHNIDNAELVLVGFGSTRGVMWETCNRISDRKIGCVHLSQVWPFPSDALQELLNGAKKVVTVENNALGQLEDLITWKTRVNMAGAIRKYDGRPFTVDELVAKIKERI